MLFLLLFAASYVSSQTLMNKDSLLRLLPKAKEDTGKVLLLINIGQQYETDEPEIAKGYYRQAWQLSKNIGYTMGEIKFITNYGYILNSQGYYDSTLELNLQSVALAKKLNNQEYIAKTLFNTGSSYRLKEEYEIAAQYYLEAYALLEKIGDKVMLAYATEILQDLYRGMKQYRKGVEYGTKAVAELKAIDNPIMLGTAYNNLGLNYLNLRLFDSARYCFNEALKIALAIGHKDIEAAQYLNFGDVVIAEGNYKALRGYMEKALFLARTLGQKESEAIALKGLSFHYLDEMNLPLAGKFADSALAIAEQFNFRNERNQLYTHLSRLSYAAHNAKLGKYYADKSAILSDSILNETIYKSIFTLEKKYETEKKNAQIKLQQATIKQKNTLNYIFIGSTAGLLMLSFLSYRTYQQKRKLQQQRINELETEKQLLATQSLLKGQEDERSRLAKDLHDGLGGLLSGVKLQLGAMKGNLILSEEHGRTFNHALNKLDESISEMRRVAHNMMPEALMKLGLQQALQDYCDGLSESQPFTINTEFYGLEQRMEASVEIVVYRIVQELVNNAVKHAEASTILAQVIKRDENLTITVEDNGKGFDKEQLAKIRTAGLHNIQSRVNYLRGQMDIQSTPGKGTSVHIDCTIQDNE